MYSDEQGPETFYDSIANLGTAAFTGMMCSDYSFELGIDVLNQVVNDPSDVTKYAAGAVAVVTGFRAVQNFAHSLGYGEERDHLLYEKAVDYGSEIPLGYGFYGVAGKTIYDNFERIKEYLGGFQELVNSGQEYKQIVEDNISPFVSEEEFVYETFTDLVSALPEGVDQLFLDMGEGFEYVSEHPVETSVLAGLFLASGAARSSFRLGMMDESDDEEYLVSEDI